MSGVGACQVGGLGTMPHPESCHGLWDRRAQRVEGFPSEVRRLSGMGTLVSGSLALARVEILNPETPNPEPQKTLNLSTLNPKP